MLASTEDLLQAYQMYIRSRIEYCSIVFHSALTQQQKAALERCQAVYLRVKSLGRSHEIIIKKKATSKQVHSRTLLPRVQPSPSRGLAPAWPQLGPSLSLATSLSEFISQAPPSILKNRVSSFQHFPHSMLLQFWLL